MQTALVEVPNSCGWGVGVLREGRAMKSEVCVCGRENALQVLTPIPHCPPASQNAQYELCDIGHFPGSMYTVAFVSAPRTCAHGGLRVHGYGGSPLTNEVCSLISTSPTHSLRKPGNRPKLQQSMPSIPIPRGEHVRQILRPGGGKYPRCWVG